MLTIRASVLNGDRVHLTIEDTGEGMTPESVEHARVRFRSTRRAQGGTGLGLPIAIRIITDDHRGELEIDSTPRTTIFDEMIDAFAKEWPKLYENDRVCEESIELLIGWQTPQVRDSRAHAIDSRRRQALQRRAAADRSKLKETAATRIRLEEFLAMTDSEREQHREESISLVKRSISRWAAMSRIASGPRCRGPLACARCHKMSEKQIGAEGGKAAAAVWGAVSTTGPAVFGAAMMLIALYYRAVGRVISQIGSTVLADGIAIKI